MGQFEKGGEVWELLRYAENLVRRTSDKKKNKNIDGIGGGLILGGFRPPGRSLEEMFSDQVGYQLVSGSVDVGLIQTAAKADLFEANKAIQKVLGGGSGSSK